MNKTNTLTIETTTACPFSQSCSHSLEKDAELKRLYAELEQLKEQCASLTSAYEKLDKKYRRLKSAIAIYQHILFGQSSEKSSPEDEQTASEKTVTSDAVPKTGRKRGGQPGHKGHGRKIPENLPVVYRTIEVPEEDLYCPICNKKHEPTDLTEESSEIDVEIALCQIVTIRKRVKRTCNCEDAGPRFITAPKAPRAIPKSKFSHNLLALFIILKFMFSMPVNRILALLGLQGETISAGSINGAFKKCLDLFEPLYHTLAKESRGEKRWNIDETSWMSFIQLPDKKNYLTWIWVFVSQKVILYIWDPSRSSRVPLAHLGHLARGFLTVDRYSAYKKLVNIVPGLVITFCWVHFRRDFIRAVLADKTLGTWAEQWKKRIGEIFRLNQKREKDPAAQEDLEEAIKKMEETITTELRGTALNDLQRKVLQSAKRHWEGLIVFVTQPQVPMDNNIAERPLRTVALGRNNYYGSRAEWSSHFTAVCLTLLKTAELHGLNPQEYLRYYLDGCGKAGGVPEDLEPYLPWNLTSEALKGGRS